MKKISERFRFVKLSKFHKLENFEIVRPFDIPQFCPFSYLPLNMNKFRFFIFSIIIFQ